MFCPKCGNRLADVARFCVKCGNPVPVIPTAPAHTPAPASVEVKEAPKKKKKTGLIIGILAAVLVVLGIVAAVVVMPMIQRQNTYDQALALMEEGEADDALELLEELGDYKDCADLIELLEEKQARYEDALALLEQDDVEQALVILKELGVFRDSEALVKQLESQQAKYEQAMELRSKDQHDEALAILVELGDYRDSQDHAADIEKMITTYEEALNCFNAEEYASALELFASLGNFRDSAELTGNVVPSAWAEALILEAVRKNDPDCYDQAAQLYLSIGMDAQAMECYLEAGRFHLNKHNWSLLRYYMTLMDSRTLAIMESECLPYSVDQEALEAVEYCLRSFYNYEGDYGLSYEALLYELYMYLQPYQFEFFMDEALETWVRQYIDGLTLEYTNLDAFGNIMDKETAYESYAMQCEAVDALAASYGLLEDDPTLYDAMVGYGGYYRGCVQIMSELRIQLEVQDLKRDAVLGPYLEFTNTMEHTIHLQYYFYLYLDSVFVATGETSAVVINPGETVQLWVNEPKNCPMWNRWVCNRNFEILDY